LPVEYQVAVVARRDAAWGPAEAAGCIGTMPVMKIEMTAPERDLLLSLLEDELGRLKGEIYKTDTWEYKEQLKSRELTLTSLIDRLKVSASA
jgi:hypothetical protein